MQSDMRVRIAFYVVALGVVGFLLVAKPFEPKAEPAYWTLRGETDQFQEIRLRLDVHGKVRTFAVRADLTCFGGGGIPASRWEPAEGGTPATLTSRGPRLRAYEVRHYPQPSGPDRIARAELRGTVSRERASGTLFMSNDQARAPDCTSGPVRWTAHR
jgi:hypothetical protein